MTLHEEVQVAAYFLWQKRGCPIGTPEEDWFHAERQFTEERVPRYRETMLVATAKEIGSVLGMVAGAFEAMLGHGRGRA
jgi:hypothetical protein